MRSRARSAIIGAVATAMLATAPLSKTYGQRAQALEACVALAQPDREEINTLTQSGSFSQSFLCSADYQRSDRETRGFIEAVYKGFTGRAEFDERRFNEFRSSRCQAATQQAHSLAAMSVIRSVLPERRAALVVDCLRPELERRNRTRDLFCSADNVQSNYVSVQLDWSHQAVSFTPERMTVSNGTLRNEPIRDHFPNGALNRGSVPVEFARDPTRDFTFTLRGSYQIANQTFSGSCQVLVPGRQCVPRSEVQFIAEPREDVRTLPLTLDRISGRQGGALVTAQREVSVERLRPEIRRLEAERRGIPDVDLENLHIVDVEISRRVDYHHPAGRLDPVHTWARRSTDNTMIIYHAVVGTNDNSQVPNFTPHFTVTARYKVVVPRQVVVGETCFQDGVELIAAPAR